jgi:hypothetical protein
VDITLLRKFRELVLPVHMPVSVFGLAKGGNTATAKGAK